MAQDMMRTETHTADMLLQGPAFYDFDHVIEIDGTPHKIVAVHRPDSSTAHYWKAEGVEPGDILLSVRPAGIDAEGVHAMGQQRKHMVKPDQPLTAYTFAAPWPSKWLVAISAADDDRTGLGFLYVGEDGLPLIVVSQHLATVFDDRTATALATRAAKPHLPGVRFFNQPLDAFHEANATDVREA